MNSKLAVSSSSQFCRSRIAHVDDCVLGFRVDVTNRLIGLHERQTNFSDVFVASEQRQLVADDKPVI